VFSSPAPLWPFGFGLSYTTFAYRDLKIETPIISSNGAVRLSFVVTNTGSCIGKEVAQVYFRDKVSSTTTPVMRLIRFQKVELEPGGSRLLAFEVQAQELALWNNDMVRVVEPGEFEIMVGDSAESICLRADFAVSN
jgi:beta-glucosidase